MVIAEDYTLGNTFVSKESDHSPYLPWIEQTLNDIESRKKPRLDMQEKQDTNSSTDGENT